MTSILIVEDDISLNAGLCFDLTEEGYHTHSASNGADALALLASHNIHLVLLDINLPDADGFLLCQQIKKALDIPVIFLSARDLEPEQIHGFECGADDYITKPFSIPLLHKRIEAVLKRSGHHNLIYSDGCLFIDFENYTAAKSNVPILFTPTEYKLLLIFTQNAGNVMTRKLLLEKLWDNDNNFVDEHALTVNINRLRSKLEDASHKYIKTVYGLGYSWIGDSL